MEEQWNNEIGCQATVILLIKICKLKCLKGFNDKGFFSGASLQVGDGVELLLWNTGVLPMRAGTMALPSKGSTSCEEWEMLGMGGDHERQREVMTLGWCRRWICQGTREDHQGFMVWVKLSRRDTGGPWPSLVVPLMGSAGLGGRAWNSGGGCRVDKGLAKAAQERKTIKRAIMSV